MIQPRTVVLAAALSLVATTQSCKNVAGATVVVAASSTPNSGKADAPYAKLDTLRKRYRNLFRWNAPNDPKLTAAFEPVRRTEGWSAFVRALRVCDDCVNNLLEQDILNWSGAGAKIGKINEARNAWRRACTFGILPPKLPRGTTGFEEQGLKFRLYAVNSADGVLVVRSQRDQVLGIFDLRLDNNGRQHVVSHMLERALRNPDAYLSYPWDIVMATDTIYIPDVDVIVDRVNKTAEVR